MRESVRLVWSQQLAGIRFTIWTSKSESVVKSTNVVESTDVIEFTDVKSTDVESTVVVELTDVLRRLSSWTLLSLQTWEIRLHGETC